jgi:hypothetical protein
MENLCMFMLSQQEFIYVGVRVDTLRGEREMDKYDREIFMCNGSYKMCKIVDHIEGYWLCFHPDKGDFIATPRLGTVAEIDATDLFRQIKEAKDNG